MNATPNASLIIFKLLLKFTLWIVRNHIIPKANWAQKFVFNHYLGVTLCKHSSRELFHKGGGRLRYGNCWPAIRIRQTFSWNLTVLMLSNTFSKWACIVCVSDACPRISRRAGSETKKNRGKQRRFFSKYLSGEEEKLNKHTQSSSFKK